MKKLVILLLLLVTLPICGEKLRIYAVDGKDYIYLGELSNQYASESVFNKYGTYGSKYGSKSIWNKYGTYGSKYSSKSPWNDYTSKPPVILDDDNRVVGYFTVNEFKCPNILIPMMRYIRENFDKCADDPGEVYEKFFR